MLFSFFHSITSSPLIIKFLIFFHFPHCKTASERFVIQRDTNKSKIHPGITVSPFYGYGIPPGKSLDGDSDSPYPRTDIKDICSFQVVSPKGLQRSCLKALSPLQIVPSTIWRNAISLGNGCRCPFGMFYVLLVFKNPLFRIL